MKKLLVVLLTLIFVLSLCACSKKTSKDIEETESEVVYSEIAEGETGEGEPEVEEEIGDPETSSELPTESEVVEEETPVIVDEDI
ncbi:MAG: hypothetical protein IKF53_05590 [Clostridia bacterium]|nr:hypothetical protein [Clostridia bacterium]